MLSGIQHFAFCNRQWALIHIEQQWAENYRTTAGELMHKKAHEEGSFEKRGDLLIVRGMRIASHVLGVSGQCDVVEFHRSEEGIDLFGYAGKWNPVPIEYKNGTPKENNADELQLCAQQFVWKKCSRQASRKDFCIMVKIEEGAEWSSRKNFAARHWKLPEKCTKCFGEDILPA